MGYSTAYFHAFSHVYMSMFKDGFQFCIQEFILCSGFFSSLIYRVGSIIPRRESRYMEFKAGGGNYMYNILPSAVQRYGSAFLNSNGGTLCIGVADDGMLRP